MANKSSRSPARSGLVQATAVFALVIMLGVGWMLREGTMDWLPAQMPAWSLSTSPKDSSGAAGHAPSLLDQLSPTPAQRGAVVGPGKIVDADHVQLGNAVFRFWGVRSDPDFGLCQANHYGWPCGTRAQDALVSVVKGGEVDCYERAISATGERLGQCFRDGVDLGGLLVESGLAYERADETSNYHVLEAIARSHNTGVWASAGQ